VKRFVLIALMLLVCRAPLWAEPASRSTDPSPTPSASPSAAVETPEHAAKVAEIRELMNLIGAARMGQQVVNDLIEQFKTTMPQVPASFWEDFQKRFKVDEIVELVVPIYDKYLTREDVQGLVSFYRSPTGQKFLSVQGKIVREAMLAGQEYGGKIAERMLQELHDKGYK
jgi:hypothetical protein